MDGGKWNPTIHCTDDVGVGQTSMGSSKDSEHDNSVSTPESFEAHLRTARDVMDTHPVKTLKMGVICCWNEFGEGSYIEPQRNGSSAIWRKSNRYSQGSFVAGPLHIVQVSVVP